MKNHKVSNFVELSEAENATWTVSFFKEYNEDGDAIVGGDLQVVMDASGNIMDLIYGE